MKYRKLQAGGLFNGHQFKDNHVLILRPDNTVEAVVPLEDAGEEIKKWDGILTPGFTNCHCHIELSHIKNVIEPGAGLVEFLLKVINTRKILNEGKSEAIEAAESEMYANGIVGVADICNTTDALEVKKESKIKWHSLVEILNILNETLPQRLHNFTNIKNEHLQRGLPAEVAPHAPYSISPATFKAINEATAGAIISIHNQETAAEDELFKTGGGNFLKLYNMMGLAASPLPVSGKSSLQTWLPYFTNGQTILLVHNTYIREDDIVFAKEHAAKFGLKIIYCLCPNANLYIEGTLPPIHLLIKHNCCIVLGTDSYSSNWQLSIASEMATIKKRFPHLPLEMLLQWATTNGATALQWNHLGSFEKGKNPGVVLLKNDFSVCRLV